MSENSEFYHPDKHLQHIIWDATELSVRKKVAVTLSIRSNEDWETIVFLPKTKRIHTHVARSVLRRLCSMPDCCLETKLFTHAKTHSDKMESKQYEKEECYTQESFLWQIAVWTSKGRLPYGTDTNTQIKLNRCPNLTHAPHLNGALSLGMLLSKQFTSLSSLVNMLDIPKADIFSFYSAAYALNLIDNGNGDSAKQGLQNKAGNMINRLMGKLTG